MNSQAVSGVCVFVFLLPLVTTSNFSLDPADSVSLNTRLPEGRDFHPDCSPDTCQFEVNIHVTQPGEQHLSLLEGA